MVSYFINMNFKTLILCNKTLSNIFTNNFFSVRQETQHCPEAENASDHEQSAGNNLQRRLPVASQRQVRSAGTPVSTQDAEEKWRENVVAVEIEELRSSHGEEEDGRGEEGRDG